MNGENKPIRSSYFKIETADSLAKSFWHAGSENTDVTALWFEADRRQELIKPHEPFAFHISVLDSAYDNFIAHRAEFLASAIPQYDESFGDSIWPYPPIWRTSYEFAEEFRVCPASMIVLPDDTRLNIFYEKESEVHCLPRAFWKPIVDKGVGFTLPRMNRGRIGQGDRIIRKRPTAWKVA